MTNIEQVIKTIEEGLNKKVVYSISEGSVFRKPEVHYTDIAIEIYKNFKMHFYLVDIKDFPYHMVLQYDIPKDKCLTNDYESKLMELLNNSGLEIDDIFSLVPGEVRMYLGFDVKPNVNTAIEVLKKANEDLVKNIITSIDDNLIAYYGKDLLTVYSWLYEDEDIKKLRLVLDFLKKKYLSISKKKSPELVDKIDALKKILVKGVNKSLVREQVMSLINDFEKEEVGKC